MAWNNDNDNGNPWQKQDPPDIEAALKKLKEQFKNSGYTGAIVAGIVVVGLFAFSCFSVCRQMKSVWSRGLASM